MADDLTPQAQPETPSAPPPTWDNVTASPSPPPAEPAPLETAEAAPPLIEPDAQPEAAAAPVREGESQPSTTPEAPKPDEYVAEADDPPEIAALTTPAAKRWAKRQFKEAEISRRYLSPDEPIRSFGDDLYQRSPSRYWEMVDDVYVAHPDYFAEKVKGQVTQPTTPAAAAPAITQPSAPSTVTTPTEAELANLSDTQIVQRFEAATKAAREEAEQKLRTEFDTRFNDLKTQFDTVNGKFTTQEQQAREQQVAAKNQELYDKVWKVVDDGIRESGLEAKADDPPRIAHLKQAARELLNSDRVQYAFDESDDNRKLVKTVFEFNRRGEFHNAFREEDNLKVRARAAFEKARQRPEVQAILSEIDTYVTQSKAKPTVNDPAPPVAGAAGGMTIKSPTTWDEAVAQAATAPLARSA